MNPVISICIIIIFTSVENRDISSLSKMSFFVYISLSLTLYSNCRNRGMCQQPLSEWSNLFWSQWWQWLCLSLSCWLWGNQLWKWYLSLLFLYFFKLLPFSNIFIMNPVISICIIIIFTSVGNRDISSLSKMSCFVFISLSLSLSLTLYSNCRNRGMCQQPLSEWSNLFWSQWWQWLCLSLSCWLWGNKLWKWYLPFLFLIFLNGDNFLKHIYHETCHLSSLSARS